MNDRDRLKSLHKSWTDLHEEQADLLNLMIQTPFSVDVGHFWSRYREVDGDKGAIIEEIRREHEKGE